MDLNLNTLGARPVEYVENMYGETGSDLHSGLGTDRFVVQWDLDSPRVEALSVGVAEDARPVSEGWPVVNTRVEDGMPTPWRGAFPKADSVLVEIPESINETKRVSRELAMRWRECTREAVVEYLGKGLRVEGFATIAPNRFAYELWKPHLSF